MKPSSCIAPAATIMGAVVLSGCAAMMEDWERRYQQITVLSPAGEQVAVVPAAGTSCAPLGPVELTLTTTGYSDAEVRGYIDTYVRNVSAERGGDTAVIDGVEAYRYVGNPAASGEYVEIRASAYDCGNT